jgi:glycosyltransferase involved in cell wall biosynthesis
VPHQKIVLTHPGKHYHFYQIALAAHASGQLSRFLTGIYYLPGKFPYGLLSLLPRALATRTVDRLRARRVMPGLDPARVQSMPYYEMAALAGDRVALLQKLAGGHRNLLLGKNACYDRWFARRLRRDDCNLVHCLWGCAWHTFQRAKQLGATTVLDVASNPLGYQQVDQEYTEAKDRLLKLSPREEAEVALADYVFSPSEFVSSGVAAMGFPRERIISIPYGVETARFAPRTEAVDESFRILFVGHVALRKGVHYLLEAFKGLDLPKAKLTIIGSPVDAASAAVLERYRGIFTWIPRVSYDELHHYYQNSDVFVFPSLAEGSALVTYEALACGLPSIVTENAGSVVREGIEGFIVPTRDPAAIREKLGRLYQDPGLVKTMGVAARKRAEDYDWQRYRERIVAAYAYIESHRHSPR